MGKRITDDIFWMQTGLDSLLEAYRRLTEQIENSGVLETQCRLAEMVDNSAIREVQRALADSAIFDAEKRLAALLESIRPFTSIQVTIEECLGSMRLSETVYGIEHFQDAGLLPELEQHLERRRILADEIANLDISRLIGAAGPADTFLDRIREQQRAIAATFRMPHVEEAAGLSAKALENLNAQVGSAVALHQEQFRQLTDAIHTPWVDTTNALSSFESMARLASVGNVLHAAPFDSLTSETLRSLLGDWSQVSFPQDIFSDWRVRESFYRDHGFDRLLTVLPEPAFMESLYETRILHPRLFPPIPPPVESTESEEPADEVDSAKQRMLKAYDILFTLEMFLREYLDEIMTAQFGPDWAKHRVPGNIYTRVEKEAQRSFKQGGKRNTSPLVC